MHESGPPGHDIVRLVRASERILRELDPDSVLDHVLETARALTGARYAAIGVLDQERRGLERFVTAGLEDHERARIGDPPEGHGLLGTLIGDPRPLRLADVGSHADSYGFPGGHPRMTSFLGVPVVIRGEPWGNLYLTDQEDGEFTEEHQLLVSMLADWAGIAIENARLFQASERTRLELANAVRATTATRDVTRAIGSDMSPERVLELIVKRGRALVDASSLVILLRDGDELHVGASAGHAVWAPGQRIAIEGTPWGRAMELMRSERIEDLSERVGAGSTLVDRRSVAMVVPVTHRGVALGVLAAIGRTGDLGAFSPEDEDALTTFAASAGNAVVTARTVGEERRRQAVAAAEAERARWARELHDETLQGLAALRLMLSLHLERRGPEVYDAVGEAVALIEQEIANLRSIITELRPAGLATLGLATALQRLAERHRLRDGPEIELEASIADGLPAEVQAVVYRVTQEALVNARKHAAADRIRVTAVERHRHIELTVRDDGAGFDPAASTDGFGLTGIRERAALAGGTIEIASGEGGTSVRATIPSHRPAAVVPAELGVDEAGA